MSNYIKVSVPKMKIDWERLQTEVEKIPEFISELDSSMKGLSQCWDGPAWVAFQQQVESDIVNMLDVYDWLRILVTTMSDVEKIYGDSEERSYSCVEKVRI